MMYKLSGFMKKNRFILFGVASFIIPLGIMLVLFAMHGIYPFGDESFVFGDFYHQYLPFFTEFMDKIHSGDSLFLSWNTGLGENFLAIFSYYLASPVNWLGVLVKPRYFMEFMTYTAVLKIGLCGVSTYLYLSHRKEKDEFGAFIFSLFYALSGYMAAYNWNTMWLDCFVVFPLVIWGLESLVKQKKTGMYRLALALSILTNFYISIIICIYLVLCFVFIVFTEDDIRKSKKIMLNRFGLFFMNSVLAAGIASILIIPSAYALIGNGAKASGFAGPVEFYFNLFDILGRHFIGVTTELQWAHWPNIYMGVLFFLLVPLYTIQRDIPLRKRCGNIALSLLFILSFSANILEYFWHGMNIPNALPARQAFIYIFLMLSMCYDVFVRIRRSDLKKYVAAMVVGLLLVGVVSLLAGKVDVGSRNELLTLFFVMVYGLLLSFMARSDGKLKMLIATLFSLVVIFESGYNMYLTGIHTTNRTSYYKNQKNYKVLLEQIEERDDNLYRVEKFSRNGKNDGTLTGYSSGSAFTSTINQNIASFYQRMGMRYSDVMYCAEGATPLAEAMLGIRYKFSDGINRDCELYTQAGSSGDVVLYESNYVLYFGYVLPYGYELDGIEEAAENTGMTYDAIDFQNNFVRSLGIEADLFTEVECVTSDGTVYFTPDEEGNYYGVLCRDGVIKMAALRYGTVIGQYQNLKAGSVLDLGHLIKDVEVKLINGSSEGIGMEMPVKIYRINTEVLKKAVEKLTPLKLEAEADSSDYIEMSVTLKERGKLVIPIANDRGWHVRVNGEDTDFSSFGNAFVALELEAGEYDIELWYIPRGYVMGAVLSIVSIMICVFLFCLRRRKETCIERQSNE